MKRSPHLVLALVYTVVVALLWLPLVLAQREDKVTLTLTGEQDGESLYTVTSSGRDGTSTSETTLNQASFDLEHERLVTAFLLAELRLRQFEGEAQAQRVQALQRELSANNLKTRDLTRIIDMIRRY